MPQDWAEVRVKVKKTVLLVAQSGRILARSAARSGLRTVTLDLFADEDTREYADCCQAIPSNQGDFDEGALLTVAEELAPSDGTIGLVYGSGIDTRPALLERLACGRVLYGNTPATLRLMKAPHAFFELLDRLAIPYPETRFIPPKSTAGWLVKPGCREGGKGVRFFAKICAAADAEDYYQRYMPGEALSALFLANGENARIIGFNTQWTASHDPGQPFLFAGAINRAALSESQRELIKEYSARLTRASGLVGLNSLDFLLDGKGCRVLEVNPRPSATMSLYDTDYVRGLLIEHIAACRGEWGAEVKPNSLVQAFRIVYASRMTVIPERIKWPQWCADRPRVGATIAVGSPLCSVRAEAKHRHEAETLLRIRESEILARLDLRVG